MRVRTAGILSNDNVEVRPDMAITQMWEWDDVVQGMKVVCIELVIDQGKMSAAKTTVSRKY